MYISVVECVDSDWPENTPKTCVGFVQLKESKSLWRSRDTIEPAQKVTLMTQR